MLRRFAQGLVICLVMVFFAMSAVVIVQAQVLQSPNYQFDESVIGGGGLIQSGSDNFQIHSSLGDLSVGEASSDNVQIDTGSITTENPRLVFRIVDANPNFGAFSASAAATATATFSVINYTSYGYVVHLTGDTPANGDHDIPAIDTGTDPTAEPSPGIEQFGVNMVANTVPESFGANPDQGQFGFGEAAPNYGVSNEFRYVSGETVALAPKSSGETIYTISYMINVAPLTPGGKYTTNQTLIVTGTY
jgi:hypothetical protein